MKIPPVGGPTKTRTHYMITGIIVDVALFVTATFEEEGRAAARREREVGSGVGVALARM